MKTRPLVERFWEKVDKNGPLPIHVPYLGRCWIWMAYRVSDGYGRINEGTPSRKNLEAHRVSWKLHNGPIPDGLWVLHSCDNPPCVNPAHLFLGTRSDNNQDMLEKERQALKEKHGSVKLTEEKIAEIRRDYVRGSRTHGQPALARKYSVSQQTICSIVRGKTWQ